MNLVWRLKKFRATALLQDGGRLMVGLSMFTQKISPFLVGLYLALILAKLIKSKTWPLKMGRPLLAFSMPVVRAFKKVWTPLAAMPRSFSAIQWLRVLFLKLQ